MAELASGRMLCAATKENVCTMHHAQLEMYTWLAAATTYIPRCYLMSLPAFCQGEPGPQPLASL